MYCRYVEIRTRGTTTTVPTTESEVNNTEPPPTTVIQLRRTTVTTENEFTTLSVDEKDVLDDNSSNNTNTQADTSNLVDENPVENISNEVTENAKTDDKRIDILEIINIDKGTPNTEKSNEQITTTIPTPNEESLTNKRRGPQAPRPAFHLRRTTTVAPVTTTIETPTTLPTSKVSLTTPRNFFRKKGFGSRDLLINRNKVNQIIDNNGNKENSVIDFEAKTQYDDTNNDQYSSRKRFRNSISLDKAVDNSYESENNSKENTDNSEYKNRLRNRGRSRYTLQTVGTTATPRPRIRVVTDGLGEDYDAKEYIRKYRPDISYEIADLSSLTAVDLKDSSKGRRNGYGRRRRPTVQVIESTTASTISTSTEAPLKTGSRTIPLARKFLENTSFDKNRRLRPTTASASSTTEGSLTTINEGQATQKRYISRLKTSFNGTEVSNNASTQSLSNATEAPTLKLPKFRKFTPISSQTTSTTEKIESIALENYSTTRKPVATRRRKILRRLKQRPTTTTTEPISASTEFVKTTTVLTESTERSITQKIYNVSEIPPIEDNPNINIITKTELLDLNDNQTVTENLLTTIASVSENNVNTEKNDISNNNKNDDENTINTTEPGDEKSKDDLDSKSNEEDDEEEGENIKLSESIVRENSQIGDFPNRNIINGFEKSGAKLANSYRTGLNNDKVDNVRFSKRPVTEPNIIIRTRKIIRKFNPTETPETDDAGNKKVRKVVRRLRPSFPLNQIDSEKTQQRENAEGYSTRRRLGFNRQSTTTEANNEKDDSNNTDSSKPLLFKRRYNSLNRKGATENIEKSKSGGLKLDKGINKSIYSRTRGTTTTTTSTTEAPTTTAHAISDNDDQLMLSLSTTDSSTSNSFETTKSVYENYSTDISTEGDPDSEKTTDLSTENIILTNTADFTSSDDDNRSTGKFEDVVSSTQQEYDVTNAFEEFNKNQTTTITESSEYTNDIMKSTTPLVNIATEEDITTTFIDDASVITNTEEITTHYDEGNLTDMSTNTDEITAAIVKTTTALPTTKRVVSTTESPLSKLLKRRRFGSNANPSESQDAGPNEDAEVQEKGRFSSLNTRLRLRKFGKSTTQGTTTKETINKSEGGNYATQESQEGISSESTSARVTSTESIDIPTISSIEDERNTYFTEYSTASVDAETVVPVDTTFDSENASTETFTAENINEENLSEITNTGISDATLSIIESTPKENILTTETLSISSTEATIPSDISTSNPIPTENSTATAFTTDEDENTESETEITTEAITTTTTRRPNRLFRPIDARPKYTVKYRPSESTSVIPSTSDSSIKSYSRYKLRTRNRNRFTFSSTTERYDENEELGYGPVKEFKSTLRVTSKLRGRDDFYESRRVEEEEEYTDENEEESSNIRDEGENDKEEEEGIAIRPSIYNRPYPYKPINPVIQKPATFTKIEEKEYDDIDADGNGENLDDPIDNIEDDKDDVRETYLYRPHTAVSPVTRASNAPIGVVSQKPVTRTYKGFRSTTSASVVQDLSDINITAINERNRNLFTKTRKQNVPVAYLGNSDNTKKANNITQNTSQIDYVSSNETHLSSNASTYNTPYYQSNLYSSTESLYDEIASADNDNITSEQNLLQTESVVLVTTESFTTLTFDTSKIEDTTEEVKSTEITQAPPTTLQPLITDTKEEETTEDFRTTEIAEMSSTSLPLNITNEKETTEELKSTQITEKSSTLLHIFAETEAPITDTTMSSNDTVASRKGNKKLEKLIEINRVIEVHAEEGFKNRTGTVGSKTVIKEPIVDKIGLVSRITEIKIVEDKNSTDNQSVVVLDQPLFREDKKYESKTDYNFNIPIVSSADITQINQIHIDSGSAVNKITPKPFYKPETSTIPLEGLFQTDSPLKYHHNIKSDSPNEILEGEHSRFVNVRILEQDITDRNAKPNHEAKFIPIKLLRDEDEITMKADVVEVTPESRHRTIKIAPIKVMLEGNV